MKVLFAIMLLICSTSIALAQDDVQIANDSLSGPSFERGTKNVNKCTPWHHMQCVYITGTEVLKDGKSGKSTRHWWRMSYIGRACTAEHGTTFGKIFEGFFAIPHYISIAIGNGVGYMIYLVRGSPEKIQGRKDKRKERRLLRVANREKRKDSS